ncbi:MAG: hypothetical protein LKK00_00520 [Intestinimonas sp.]|jgi:hypothetical protein|nr:hypothetical protein [Intestinimonas sp.]
MPVKTELIFAVSPSDETSARGTGRKLAHMAYRVGAGARLLRAGSPGRNGLLFLNDGDFDGRGDPTALSREIIRECAARSYNGAVFDFSRRVPTLSRAVNLLSGAFRERGWSLYVTEPYAREAAGAKVLIPTAVSGGSLHQRFTEAVEQYGAERVAVAAERVAEDFSLPAPNGQGTAMTQEQLRARMEQRSPSVFFSDMLCAHYFTYMDRKTGAHFILFDTADSLKKKIQVAREVGISDVMLPYPEVADLLPDLLENF